MDLLSLSPCSTALLALLAITQTSGTPTYQWSQPDCSQVGVDYSYDNYQGPSYQETLQEMIAETLAAIRDIIHITSKAVREELMFISQKIFRPSWECSPDVDTSYGPADYPFTGYPGQPIGSPVPFSEGDISNQNEIKDHSSVDERFGENSETLNLHSTQGNEENNASLSVSHQETPNLNSTQDNEENKTSSIVLHKEGEKQIIKKCDSYVQESNNTSKINTEENIASHSPSTMKEQHVITTQTFLGNSSTAIISTTSKPLGENKTDVSELIAHQNMTTITETTTNKTRNTKL